MLKWMLVVPVVLGGLSVAKAQGPLDPMKYARGAAQWILSLAKNQNGVMTWPVNDSDKKDPDFQLYSGMPGGILLLAELAKEDPAGPFRDALAASVAGLQSLQLDEKISVWGYRVDGKFQIPGGLYTGNAGVAWLYLELYHITGEKAYLDKARTVNLSLLRRIRNLEGRAIWDSSTDVISGAAGTGLYFLRAAADLKEPLCLEMAMLAGNFLILEAIQTPTGFKWKISPSVPGLYPNFSHGTAGVAYFLLRLYEATSQLRYFEAGFRGVREMQTIANVKDNACAWYHHEDGGENLWYVGWCHGPAGTARLFFQLDRALPKTRRGAEWVDRAAKWLLATGIPDPAKPIDGYWNEGICCGTAGVGEFLVDLYLNTKKREYLQGAEKMAAHLAKAAEPAGTGYRWVQAENRESPDKRDAQTGYAQGAAGIGLFFLKLSRAQRGVPVGWRLPDNPF